MKLLHITRYTTCKYTSKDHQSFSLHLLYMIEFLYPLIVYLRYIIHAVSFNECE